jgi:hypothetical protein
MNITDEVTWRNPVVLPDGRIDCELRHPKHGWIPFTADPNDEMEHGRIIHAEIKVALENRPGV